MFDTGTKKRILIITILISVVFLLGLFIYFIFKDPASCVDGKLNQNEDKIDCGGVCTPCVDFSDAQELTVKNTEFVFGGSDTYDALARISNPNANIGSSSFSYKAILKDSSGNVLGEKEGKSFILPAEVKYIIVTGFSVDRNQAPAKLDFEISDIKWELFSEYQKPMLRISGKRFNLLNEIVGGEAYGLLKNESSFDFSSIKINVILRDSSDKAVAVNSTKMNTVRSQEERDFKLIWPYQIPGEVVNIDVEAEVDIYNSENFLRTYAPKEILPFQQY